MLISNISQAKIKSIGNGLTINIPNKYKYFEITFRQLISRFPEIGSEDQIYDDLETITTRFNKHFDNVYGLRKKLEEAMTVVDSFGKDARSISRTLENIKDPDQIETAVQTENVEKFVNNQKQLKN